MRAECAEKLYPPGVIYAGMRGKSFDAVVDSSPASG
jgi:hypothetical protein